MWTHCRRPPDGRSEGWQSHLSASVWCLPPMPYLAIYGECIELQHPQQLEPRWQLPRQSARPWLRSKSLAAVVPTSSNCKSLHEPVGLYRITIIRWACVGVLLDEPVFTHGQLYVESSRCGDPQNIKFCVVRQPTLYTPKSCLTTADKFLLCMCCNFIVHNSNCNSK